MLTAITCLDYQFALSRLPRSKSAALYSSFTKFEKQHGTRSGVESTVLGKRRIQYEEELSHDANNYVSERALASLRPVMTSADSSVIWIHRTRGSRTLDLRRTRTVRRARTATRRTRPRSGTSTSEGLPRSRQEARSDSGGGTSSSGSSTQHSRNSRQR